MPRFSYHAVDKKGTQVSDMVQADSLALAIDYVRKLGQFPTSIREEREEGAPASRLKSQRFSLLSGWRVRSREVCEFARELANMVSAGLSLSFGLSILHDRQKRGDFKNIVGQLAADVRSTMKFSEALAKYPETFDEFFVNMVRSGENAGALETALATLADAEEEKEAVERKQRTRTRRNSMAFLVGIVICTYFLFFRLGPGFLKGRYFALWRLERQIWDVYSLTIACLLGFFIGMKLLLMIPAVRAIRDAMVLKLPRINRGVKKKHAADFARTMGALLGNNMTPLEALDTLRKTAANLPMARALGRVSERVREGETLADALRPMNVLPPMALDMIEIGEDTANLGQMMLRIADIYETEDEVRESRSLPVLARVILIVLGGIVAFAAFYALFIDSGGGSIGDWI